MRARTTILAGGGIETSRLLLAEQARRPEKLGHLRAIGRYYAGHLTGDIASITFAKRADAEEFTWRPLNDRGFTRRIFRTTSSGAKQDANLFFWARNWPEWNADHGSGILSAKHLSNAFRKGRIASKGSPARHHLRNVVRDIGPGIRAAAQLWHARFNTQRAGLDYLIPNRTNCFRLSYHAEQEPHAENRIVVDDHVEPNRLPRLRIRYDFSQADISRVIRGHELLEQSLKTSGIAQLAYDAEPEARDGLIQEKACDGFHQSGLARMGDGPKDSVVNRDCKVHGIDGLYLAGAAVFRTSGAPQPTLSIVAFSMKLADHLASTGRAPSLERAVQ
nr:GMC family oxidoreductase [Marivita sp. GX14005]